MAAAVTTRMAETAETVREVAETVREVAETVANWEVGQIMGTDSEGTMSDDDGTRVEATAECF
jgi:hypothetical protein